MNPLLHLLVCPRCRGELTATGSAFHCRGCESRFPLRDGAPRMCDGCREGDPRLEAEWTAQRNSVRQYVDRQAIFNHWERRRLPRLLDWTGKVEGPLLDLGCGVGHFGAVLVEQGRADLAIVGIDFHADLLAEVRSGYGLLIEGDVRQLPIRDHSIGAVIASNSLHHFTDPEAALREITRVLAPGGTLVTHDPRSLAPLDAVRRLIRRFDDAFTADHRAFGVDEYRALLGSSGLQSVSVTTVDPIGPLVATGLDYLRLGHLGLGRLGLSRLLAHGLAEIDRLIEGSDESSPLGLMLAGRAVKPN